ncbi:Zinc finger protein MSN2 [Colletotrichum sidae]|uniref:Zinc finger protein MSN2 n=1 Tax=Colletotrichum sidae TaxID=1347389 RepID=A0A4R8TNI0_9PEZI|nr:Zinc finger protein MSN2 [Colletotrichum sidae]
MADETRETSSTKFECAYCRRNFTKKEHLKPFRCAICDRSFSRGDVLSRHVKAHKQHLQPRDSGVGSENQAPVHPFRAPRGESSTSQQPLPALGIGVGGHADDGGNGHRAHAVNQPQWQPPAARPFAQQDASSSLIWPDSEGLFQSLISAEGMTWDQSMSGLIPGADIPTDVPSVSMCSTADELAAAEDGHRAVQTINGLLTNTLFNVTSHVELSDLTPRFLDSSLHMFFTKFVPILPLIHRPTFVYRDFSAPLLLNAIALGSLFLGTDDANIKGEALWRLAYTAIATSWPEMIGHQKEYDACSGIELVLTALLSQTYAALSRNRTLRMTSQTFYGLSMHWAQYCGMYEVLEMPQVPREYEPVDQKMHAWRSWAARETQIRTLLGLCVIDGVVSQFSGNLVNTWPATNSLPLAAHEDIFGADTVDDWIRAMNYHNQSVKGSSIERFHDLYRMLASEGSQLGQLRGHPGLLNIKILLEILSSLATDFERTNQGSAVGSHLKIEAVRALCSLRQHLTQTRNLNAADRSIGLLRWHAVCLDLVASTARGARRMCHHHGITQHIFGGKKRQETRQISPEGWLQRPPARKCLLHALEIHRIASEVPLGVIHDTCLPGALFAAATTYGSHALPGISKILVPGSVDWTQVLFYGLVNASAAESPASDKTSDTVAFLESNSEASSTTTTTGWSTRNLVYELNAIRILLHSLSQHWGVTKEMEEVVGAWEAQCR